MIEWTMQNHSAANDDGWGIYHITGRPAWTNPTKRDVRIEGSRTLAGNTDENQRWADYVARRADEGSELHIKALAYVAQQRLLA